MARGDFVVGLVRDRVTSNVRHLSLPSATVFGDLNQVERILAEYEVDTVFHLAAQTQVSTAVADPVGTLEANVRGTWQVLEACRRQKVQHVIVASTDKVYGDGPAPYFESQPLLPGGIYGTSKLAADVIAQAYAREFSMAVAITRCGNLYGPGHTNWSTLIPGTIKSVLRGERPRLRSTGGPRRDFLFVEDAVDGYLALAEARAVGAFNFGTGVGTSVREVVDKILIAMNRTEAPVIDPVIGGAVEIDEQVLDWTRARQVLGWEPKHTLADGLKKTIEWYRLHLEALE